MIKKHFIASTRPQADGENIVLWRDYLVTVLADKLFRLEKSDSKRFRDDATQSVWYRDMPPQTFAVEQAPDQLTISTFASKLKVTPEKADCRIGINGKRVAANKAASVKEFSELVLSSKLPDIVRTDLSKRFSHDYKKEKTK